MFLMLAEALHTCQVAASLREAGVVSGTWEFFCRSQSHVTWSGASLHDIVQPSFSFLVGLVMPLSIAGRVTQSQSKAKLFRHALWRAAVLVAIGVGVRCMWSRRLVVNFEDTLAQIGLGYPFLFLLAFTKRKVQWRAFVALLLGVWLMFVLYPLPGPDFDHAAAGVSADFLREHGLSGLMAHFQKNSNVAWAADRVILNLFPRSVPFRYNEGGYATLSFIPTLATMLLGMLSYPIIASQRPRAERARRLTATGLACIAAGWALAALGLCPIVKRIWTPSFVLYSGGYCLLLLAGFFTVMDVFGKQKWAHPLRVLGANSLLAYILSQFTEGLFAKRLVRYLGDGLFSWAGAAYEPFIVGAVILIFYWVLLDVMFRRKIFLKI